MSFLNNNTGSGSSSGTDAVWGSITGDIISQQDLQSQMITKIDVGEKGIVNGVAPLDNNNLIPFLHLDFAEGIDISSSTQYKVVDANCVIDEDDMISNSDQRIPTQQSVKKYVDDSVGVLGNVFVFKGDWDASLGLFPGSGIAKIGETWLVSVAGTVDGIAFSIGDKITAIADNASQSSYDANWQIIDNTEAVSSVFGRSGVIVSANDDYNASQITNTPFGSLSATTVQNAINELDAKKLRKNLTSGNVLIGNASNVATDVAISGDGTIDNTGNLTIVDASTTVSGKTRLATTAEALAGTDFNIAMTPKSTSDAFISRNLATKKGDIPVALGADVFGTVGAGKNGAFLMADSNSAFGLRYTNGIFKSPVAFTMVVLGSTNPVKPTNAVEKAYYSVFLNQMTLSWGISWDDNTGAQAGSNSYKFQMPSGWVIDSAKINISTGTSKFESGCIGSGRLHSITATVGLVVIALTDTSLILVNSKDTTQAISGGYGDFASSGTNSISFTATFPVLSVSVVEE